MLRRLHLRHDSRDDFNYLKARGIAAGIKARVNSTRRSKGSLHRREEVLAQRNYKKWCKKMSYGKHWLSETTFSCWKNMFDDYTRDKRFDSMARDIVQCFVYNLVSYRFSERGYVLDGFLI